MGGQGRGAGADVLAVHACPSKGGERVAQDRTKPATDSRPTVDALQGQKTGGVSTI